MSMTAAGRVFYFGCVGRPGHYMHSHPSPKGDDERRALSHFVETNPWRTKIDGGLCPRGPQIEGQVALHRKGGWTAIAFWDRSVDRRQGSNSAFLVWGTLTADEILNRARSTFPEVFARFGFPVASPATEDLNDASLRAAQQGVVS